MAGTFVCVPVVLADFDLNWFTVDGGGEMWSTGGGLELSGTIGQPDAGAAIVGAGFELTGGFWPGSQVAVVPGDCDGDGHVDLDDFALVAPCLDGPAIGVSPGCSCSDLDADGDSDLGDFAAFQRVVTEQ